MDRGSELLSTIEEMLVEYKSLMNNKRIDRSIFDIYSYKAWAIDTLLNNISDCTHHADTSVIRALIFIHMDEYDKFIDNSIGVCSQRYCAALEAMKEVEIVSRLYL